ncbi:CLC_0170 family protein [Geosporobacter subterraneus]|uniref:CLC_0170 family protein n=1 Tax=Geosporobacter subterraneus TaxID=390806 RepID=UPI000DA607A7
MNIIVKEVETIYSAPVMMLVIAVGLFSLLFDGPALKKKKLKNEAKLCRYMGLLYIFGGIGLYILLQIF